MTSATAAANAIKFRCDKCWREVLAAIENEHTETQCPHCAAELTVPEVSDRNTTSVSEEELAAHLEAPTQSSNEASLTDAEIYKSVRADTYVSLEQRDFTGYPNASLMSRLFASLIDGAFSVLTAVFGILLVVGGQKFGVLGPQDGFANDSEQMSVTAMIVIYGPILMGWIFQWNLIASRGQSIGKFLCCIRIVRTTGHLPGFFNGVLLRNWVRNLLCIIPFFGLIDILFIFGSAQRCIHDYLADTRVVHA
ncbi:MAG: RDD family protein [Pirellulaceae bacterium]